MRRVLIARVGTERFGFPIGAIRELLDAPAVLPAAMAPRGLAGHLDVEGRPVPLLEPEAVLGVARGSGAQAQAGVALLLSALPAALWLDDAEDLWEVEDTELRPAPVGADARGAIGGLVQRGRDVVALVDVDALGAVVSATLHESL